MRQTTGGHETTGYLLLSEETLADRVPSFGERDVLELAVRRHELSPLELICRQRGFVRKTRCDETQNFHSGFCSAVRRNIRLRGVSRWHRRARGDAGPVAAGLG